MTNSEEESVKITAHRYMTDLQVPTELSKIDRTKYAIYLMVESSKITKQRKLVPECKESMRHHLADI